MKLKKEEDLLFIRNMFNVASGNKGISVGSTENIGGVSGKNLEGGSNVDSENGVEARENRHVLEQEKLHARIPGWGIAAHMWLHAVRLNHNAGPMLNILQVNLKAEGDTFNKEDTERINRLYEQENFYTGGQTAGFLTWISLLARLDESTSKELIDNFDNRGKVGEDRLDKEVIQLMAYEFRQAKEELIKVLQQDEVSVNVGEIGFVRALMGIYDFRQEVLEKLANRDGDIFQSRKEVAKVFLSRTLALALLIDIKNDVELAGREEAGYNTNIFSNNMLLRLHELASIYNLILTPGAEPKITHSLTVGIDRAIQDIGDLWLVRRFPQTFAQLQDFLIQELGEDLYNAPPYKLLDNTVSFLKKIPGFSNGDFLRPGHVLTIASRKSVLSLLEKFLLLPNRSKKTVFKRISSKSDPGIRGIRDADLGVEANKALRHSRVIQSVAKDLVRARVYLRKSDLQEVLSKFSEWYLRIKQLATPGVRRMIKAIERLGLTDAVIQHSREKFGYEGTRYIIPQVLEMEEVHFVTSKVDDRTETQGVAITQSATFIPLSKVVEIHEDKYTSPGGKDKGQLHTYMWFVRLQMVKKPEGYKRSAKEMRLPDNGLYNLPVEIQLVNSEYSWKNSIGLAIWHMLRHKKALDTLGISEESWANGLLARFDLNTVLQLVGAS